MFNKYDRFGRKIEYLYFECPRCKEIWLGHKDSIVCICGNKANIIDESEFDEKYEEWIKKNRALASPSSRL